MGCLCSTPTGIDDLILFRQPDILLYDVHSKKKTPSSYLIELGSIKKTSVPSIVVEFYQIVGDRQYEKVMQNKYKDIYFCGTHVYSVEVMKEYIYTSIQKMHNVTSVMNHVLTPDEMYYYPLDDSSGLLFQKTHHCTVGDLWYRCFKNGYNSIDIDSLVYSLASTLKALHNMNIFLMDIKLENILGSWDREKGKTCWYFADCEYAWVNPLFAGHECKYPENEMKARNKGKFKWVKTIHYLPNGTYPYCREIAIRNDCFALARCIGTLVHFRRSGEPNAMFYGNKKMDLYDLRDSMKAYYPNDKYLHVCGDCIIEYGTHATHEFLNRLIKISTT